MDSAGREMRGPSLRILVSIDTLYGPGFAGMQRVAQETCRRLVARGHFVTVLVAGRNDDPLVDEVDGVRVVRYDAEGGAVRAMRASASAAKGIIEGERIDVVHAHFAYSALGPSFAALRAKVPIVRTYHGAWDAEARAERRTRRKPSDVAGDALRYLIELASLRSANAVATLSNYSAEQVRRRFGIAASRIAVLTGGVDLEGFAVASSKPAERANLGVATTGPLIVAVGRLVARKGFDRFIEALGSGTPVVVTPVGASREIVNALEPRLVSASTAAPAIAANLVSFFNDTWAARLTPEFLRSFVEQRYSWDLHASGMEDLLRSAAGRRESGKSPFGQRKWKFT